MCSGRVDLAFVLKAFSLGADGVFMGACHLNECNYVTHGNYHAMSMVNICKKIMKHAGLNPERLALEFMSGSEANVFVEAVNGFIRKIKETGPLGEAEGIDERGLKVKLEAITELIPYIRLVERERLRASFDSEESCKRYYQSEEIERLFNELIFDKLSISQIVLLLREKSLSTAEISGVLGMDSSAVSRHLNTSSRHRLVRYDQDIKCYALA